MSRVKIELEFIFRASPAMLHQFITLPENLVRWFADGVDISDDLYTFSWDGSEESAVLLDDIEEERLRFKWEDSEEGEYFEFRMYISDITRQTILEITDFCDDDEVKEQSDLWSKQIDGLHNAIGG